MQGALVVKPMFGTFSCEEKNTNKENPFLVLEVGTQTQRTKVCCGGGKNPTWNDTLTFQVNGDQMLTFKLMEKDWETTDDEIGIGQVNLIDVFQCRSVKNAYPCI